MNRILLLDTNFSSAPIYQTLVEGGNEVFIVGRNKEDFLARSIPNHILLDYTDIPAMRKKIMDLGIKYIVPGCNDISYEVCATLNENRDFHGIDSLETTKTLNNKRQFRLFLKQHGLPSPHLFNAEQPETFLEQAVIIKPVDAYSGKGVTILSQANHKNYAAAVQKARAASRSGQCIVEEFVSGQLYSHSAFIKNNQIFIDFIVTEYSTVNPFTVDTSHVCQKIDSALQVALRQTIERIAHLLQIEDGLLHTQFISDGKSLWLIEITRRCPGDLYSQLIELSTGFPYAQAYANSFIEQEQPLNSTLKPTRPIVRHTISQDATCTLLSVDFKKEIIIRKWVPISISGDRLLPSPAGRVAVIFLEGSEAGGIATVIEDIRKEKLYSLNIIRTAK